MALLVVVALAPAAEAAPGALPWSVESEVDGWRIERVQRHPEFVRLQLKKGDTQASLEVTPPLADDPFSTGYYRVQPPPGAKVNQGALTAILAALRAWERRPDHVPFVSKVIEEPVDPDPDPRSAQVRLPTPRLIDAGSWPPEGRWGWLLGDALLLALVAACLARRRRKALWGFGAAVAVGIATWLLVSPELVPARWITVLQEGSVASVVASLHGQGHHGAGFDALRWLLGGGQGLPIRDVVQMNLALAAMNTVGVGLLTWSLSGRPALGLLMAAAWGLGPLQVNAAFSDLPAVLLWTYVLAGVVAVGVMDRDRWLALATLSVAAVLAGGVRLEWGLLGGVAAVSALCSLVMSESWRERLDRGWTSVGMLVVGAAVIALVGTVGEGTSASAPRAWSMWQSESGGAIGLGLFTWPLGLAAVWPIGLVALATWGMLVALRRPMRWTAAPAAALLLQGVYWTSAHGGDAPYEVLRYAALMSGLAIALAAFGWQTVLAWCEARSRGSLAWVALAGLCVVPLPDGLWRPALETHHAESEGTLYDMPLTRHLQAEARSLIDATESNPACLLVTVSAVEPSAAREVTEYEYVFFGGSLAAPMISDRAPAVFGELVDAVRTRGECVLFHRGLDCHVLGGPDCREEVAGARFVHGVQRAPRPYYDHVLREEPLRLEVWAR